jgi:glycosyltransferase involved in cell wall biosynthesis
VTRPRRVAVISNLCPHYRRPLYEELARRFELECFFFAEDEPYWNPMLPAFEEGDFRRVDLRRVTVFGEPLLPGLAKRLTRARYDAVVVALTGRIVVPYTYAVARARRLPLVLWTGTWHHPQTFFHRRTEGLVRGLYRGADAIVVYGDHVRRALTAVRGVDDAKIFTAAQAVDGQRFEVESDPARSREIVFVGQFQEWKGVRDLLEAFGQVNDQTLKLTFVGNGPLDRELAAAAARDPRIRVRGHVPQESMPGLLAQARFLVLPSVTTDSYREAWGLVVNEAMHVGLPVVATDAVGAAEHGLVENMSTGLVVAERDPTGLAAALSALGEDDVLVSTLGRNARQRVAGYTFAGMADAFEAAVAHAEARRA